MRLSLLAMGLVLAGCGDGLRTDVTGEPSSSPASYPLEIELDDGTVLRGNALVVSLVDGPDGFVQVRVDGMDDLGAPGWSALAVGSVDDLTGGELTFDLRKLPLADGIANAARHYADESFMGADSGELQLSLGTDGEVGGLAEAAPAEVSATIRGPYTVECWVAPEALGEAPNGSGDGSGKVRILDEEFESAFCSRFAAWR